MAAELVPPHAPVAAGGRLRVLRSLLTSPPFGARLEDRGAPGRICTRAYMLAMLLNAFVPHLAVTLATRSLMPGVATGLFLVAPVTAAGLYFMLRQGYIGREGFLLSAPLVVAGLLASLPLLFRLGGLVRNRHVR